VAPVALLARVRAPPSHGPGWGLALLPAALVLLCLLGWPNGLAQWSGRGRVAPHTRLALNAVCVPCALPLLASVVLLAARLDDALHVSLETVFAPVFVSAGILTCAVFAAGVWMAALAPAPALGLVPAAVVVVAENDDGGDADGVEGAAETDLGAIDAAGVGAAGAGRGAIEAAGVGPAGAGRGAIEAAGVGALRRRARGASAATRTDVDADAAALRARAPGWPLLARYLIGAAAAFCVLLVLGPLMLYLKASRAAAGGGGSWLAALAPTWCLCLAMTAAAAAVSGRVRRLQAAWLAQEAALAALAALAPAPA
jgi:hypothetical protein